MLEAPDEAEKRDTVELLPTDLVEAEERVEGPEEIVMSPPFNAESLEDFRVVDDVVRAASSSFLADPRFMTGAGELDKLDRGEDERVEVVGLVVLREK